MLSQLFIGVDCIGLIGLANGDGMLGNQMEQAVTRIAADPGLRRVHWQVLGEA